jgi:hypothetical protein
MVCQLLAAFAAVYCSNLCPCQHAMPMLLLPSTLYSHGLPHLRFFAQVIAIESCLKSPAVGRADLAGLLRQVQELERDKLRLTLSWYVCHGCKWCK